MLLNAVNPRIGGVLVRGEKGTAKSTAVRALAGLLPEIQVADGCPFACDPSDEALMCDACRESAGDGPLAGRIRRMRVVDLPIGATEDRVVGALDIEQALVSGRKAFQPGVLAEANRGILYVDEINLLEDHIVDLLLDAAAMGVNTVQREGISLSHSARFVLVGTMNPEEGDLRPQLIDRFGLCADVAGMTDVEERMEIVRRRAAWEADPEGFCGEWADAEADLARKVQAAVARIETVGVDDSVLRASAEICVEMGVQGHRADITIVQSARTLAGLEGRDEVSETDMEAVVPLCLTHRMRRLPFDEEPLDEVKLAELLRKHRLRTAHRQTTMEPRITSGAAAQRPSAAKDDDGGVEAGSALARRPASKVAAAREVPETPGAVAPIGSKVAGPRLQGRTAEGGRDCNGKHPRTPQGGDRGRYVGSKRPKGRSKDPAIDATLRAAAANGKGGDGELAVTIDPADLREKIRARKAGATILFCVDASGSMRAKECMEAAKAAVMSLLVDAYKRRDKVGMVAFRGKRADVVLAPTRSVELAHTHLRELPTGGTTPLAHGLATSLSVLSRAARAEGESVPWLVLVTDGNANVPIGGGLPEQEARSMAACFRQRKINSLVIDAGRRLRSETLAKEIADAAGAQYLRLDELGTDGLGEVVRKKVRDWTSAVRAS